MSARNVQEKGKTGIHKQFTYGVCVRVRLSEMNGSCRQRAVGTRTRKMVFYISQSSLPHFVLHFNRHTSIASAYYSLPAPSVLLSKLVPRVRTPLPQILPLPALSPPLPLPDTQLT